MKLVAVFTLVCLWITHGEALIHLEAYNVDPASVTVSGISSGAAMATQLHVALSSTVHGAAIFAGVPYYCAQGLLAEALVCMETPSLIFLNQLILETNTFASLGYIDATSNLSGDKVYVFAGNLDTVVQQGTGVKVQEYYEHYGADVTTEYTVDAEHCLPTDFYGRSCNFLGEEYINNCAYHGAYNALNTLYGDIVQGTGEEPLLGIFDQFDQTDFFEQGTPSGSSMDDVGFAYIPSGCVDKTATCRLHVALHGCLQGRHLLDDVFARNTGYLQVAELNNIIVLFPQAISKSLTNPNGCWDWWGYTGLQYANHKGEQIVAIQKMIETILG